MTVLNFKGKESVYNHHLAVPYQVMGGGYDAAGEKYGVSAKALLVVPLVGAFFIDIMNAIIIQGFLWAVG